MAEPRTPKQLKEALAGLGCPAVSCATIAGLSKSRLSEILAGQHQPVNGEIAHIEAAIAEMQALLDEHPGLPIDFSDGVRIRQLLEVRRESPAREIQAILRELKVPFQVFVKLQVDDLVNLSDAYKVLNGIDANPEHTRVLLQLAKKLQDYAQTFPEPNWVDVYAVRSTLRRWAEIERARKV
jgi:predicted transcriptional regulator